MTVRIPYEAGITRTMDATLLNRVANDPAVRPFLGGDGPIDVAPLLANPANLAGVSEHGGFVCIAQGPRRYEVHSLFLPERPRGETVRAMRAAVNYFFAFTDGWELVTKVPVSNLAAIGLARLAGFEALFNARIQWSAADRCELVFLSLSIDRWALHAAETLTLGGWLHEQFEQAKAAHASRLPAHSDDDDAHDRMAGAAVLMVQAGQPQKAVEFYNRWAKFAGYPGVRLLRESPTVLDLEGLVIEARGQEIEVLSCQ